MASSSNNFIMEKLNGMMDYHNWKFQMKMILVHEDLWDCVQSEKVTDEKKDLKALAKICLSVSTSAFPHVRNATTAYGAWKNLEKAYEDKGLCRRLSLLRSLFGLKQRECADMDTYLSKITEIAQKLSDIGSPLEDDFLAVIILSGLPEEYEPLIMTLENNNVKLSSDFVKSKLLQENQRRLECVIDDNNVTALAVKKTVKCFKCKKAGHIMKNCPKISQNKERPMRNNIATMLGAFSVVAKEDAWCIDSGATNHMCNNKLLFDDYEPINCIEVNVANGDKLSAVGKGNIKIKLRNLLLTVSDVYYVPNLSVNLLSVSCMTRKGYTVTFNLKGCKMVKENKLIATATQINNVFQLDTVGSSKCNTVSDSAMFPRRLTSQVTADTDVAAGTVEVEPKTATSSNSGGKVTQETWHRRLGHLNSRSMYVMKKGMVTGIHYDDNNYQSCVACVKGKQARLPFPKKSESRSTELLGLIHTDLCGPMSQSSFGGSKYFLTFIDDYSRKTYVYFLKSKHEVFDKFKQFKVLVENQTSKKIKVLRSDNGLEYMNNKFQNYLKEHGIVHQTTVPYSPAQNGVSERANRTIVEKARCMLEDAGLDKRFWAEAVQTAVYLKNRSPTKAVMGKTPEEKWSGKRVNVSHLKIFGCVAYALVHNRKKLDSKSKKYIFVGYCEDSKGYRLVDPDCPTVCIKARNVRFFENQFTSKSSVMSGDDKSKVVMPITNEPSSSESFNDQSNRELTDDSTLSDDIIIKSSERRQEIIDVNDTDKTDTSISSAGGCSDVTYVPGSSEMESEDTYEECSGSEDTLESNMVWALSIGTDVSDTPMTVQDALSTGEANHWRAAMQDEYDSLIQNKVWTLTNLDNGQKPIECKWVFKIKRGLNGKTLKYKARLVAKGFTQKYGIDYNETFAPVVRYSTIRMLFAIAVEYNLSINQLDVKTAFLNGDLAEHILMKQPEGFVVKGKENMVLKLNKSIYGLKQAAKCWYDKLHGVLTKKMCFSNSSVEPCVYFRHKDGRLTIIAIYVDDILLFTSSDEDGKKIKDQLSKEFEIKDLGTVHEFLGMRICKDQNRITLDQSHYIENVLKRFKMQDCKPVSTPMEPGVKLVRAENNYENCEYRNLIGCLMYIAVCTRPDIAHAVSFLSQFNNYFSDIHFRAAKRVLRYLKGTLGHKLIFEKSGLKISGYTDADWASCEVDRKSYTGYVYKIGTSVVSWESRKQRTVALSSTEAEYMALSDATKEALFIRTFLKECLKLGSIEIVLYNDNQSAQKLCSNPMFHSRTKHIDIRHHFVKDTVKRKLIDIKYLSTDKMIADLLTKPVVRDKFVKLVQQLNLGN